MALADTVSKVDHLTTRERACIESCFEAAEACEWCADTCIDEEGQEAARCLRLCRDVADVAPLLARFLARESNYASELATVVAGACEECAEVCARMDTDACQDCADELRECAANCRAIRAA